MRNRRMEEWSEIDHSWMILLNDQADAQEQDSREAGTVK